MPVNIHGKQYVTVAERVSALHEARNGAEVQITTTITEDTPEQVVVRATVRCAAGTFTGHAHSMKNAGSVEGQAPLEVAETSAVGRALGFAGYGSTEGIASADEMQAAGAATPPRRPPPTRKPPARRPSAAPAPAAPEAPEARSQLFGLATEMWGDKDTHAAICAALSLPSDGEGAIREHWLDKGGTYKQAQMYLAEVRRLEVSGKSFEDAARVVNAYAQLTVTE
ncbi:hypothetical protein LCGC14_1227160 [marine sediment metagenome]|uniref:Uncharacterized protein n=1 Tax=marine sediment metagenome TaxID=412755 RepID=A0A0F9LDN2_9ZZZZ